MRMIRLMICKKTKTIINYFNPPPATPSLYSIQTDDELALTRVIEFSIFFFEMALIHFDTQCRMSSSKKHGSEEVQQQDYSQQQQPCSPLPQRQTPKSRETNICTFHGRGLFKSSHHQQQVMKGQLTTLPRGKLYVLCQLSVPYLCKKIYSIFAKQFVCLQKCLLLAKTLNYLTKISTAKQPCQVQVEQV